MPARTRKIRHDEQTRAKIQTSQLMNRLTDHVLGKVELSSTQVTAALGLLRKTLPDLQNVEVTGDVQHHYVAALPEPTETTDAWEQQHKPTTH